MHKLPDISDWPDRASDEGLPLGFLPEERRKALHGELRQSIERLKKIIAFRSAPETLGDFLTQMQPTVH
jgi:hypothetical protein